jgi:hypothetical protein
MQKNFYSNTVIWKGERPMGMRKMSDERRDNMLGGVAIILLGVLLSGSAIWGLVFNIYSMSGAAPPLFMLLGVGSIILGAAIALYKPESQISTEE